MTLSSNMCVAADEAAYNAKQELATNPTGESGQQIYPFYLLTNASGGALTVQWYKNGTLLDNGSVGNVLTDGIRLFNTDNAITNDKIKVKLTYTPTDGQPVSAESGEVTFCLMC